MTMMKRLAALVLALAMLLTLAACGAADDKTNGAAGRQRHGQHHCRRQCSESICHIFFLLFPYASADPRKNTRTCAENSRRQT